MKINKTRLDGCVWIEPFFSEDLRGGFVKTFYEPFFSEHGLPTVYAEEYYSVSKKQVIRGLHFQSPPAAHEKLVYCCQGEVRDVVVDLRKKSPTFGQYEVFVLNDENKKIVYIPKGFAHGFEVLSEQAVMMYKVTSLYSPEHDQGIRWNSLNIAWSFEKPIISERDQQFPRFSDFSSPF